jgi:uncharacterized membrane protein
VSAAPGPETAAPEPAGAGTEGAGPRRAGRAAQRLAGIDLAAWFLLFGAVFGVALVFFVPPAQGQDEPNHFFRAYTVTQGTIVAPIPHGRAGVVVPACTYDYVNDLYVMALKPVNLQLGDFWKTPAGCAGQPGQFVPIENTAVNSPVSYLPQEVAILFLRLLGASVPVIFFGGRLAGLAAYLALIYLAIRVAPRGRAVFFVVALLPSSLGLASAYSADGMTIGLALLSIALALRGLLDEDAGRLWFLALAGCLVVLAVTKNTYFVLAPLVLLVPARRLRMSPRAAAAAKAATLAVAGLAAGAWYLAVRNVSLAAYAPVGTIINPHLQIHYIIDHPIGYAHILTRSIFQAGPESYFVPGFVQTIGNFRAAARGTPLAPAGLIVVVTLILAAAFRHEIGARREGVTTVDRLSAALPVVLGLISVLVIFSALWWQWTPVGARLVRGVQGRYFLPLVPLPLITIALLRAKPAATAKWAWILVGTGGLLLYTLVKVGVLFY